MTAYRRLAWNHALQHAVEEARRLSRPLVILEGLRVGHPWASRRFHHFVLGGMRESRERLRGSGVAYLPYVEPEPGAGRGLLETLAGNACVVVTDDFPAFFLPRMLQGAADRLAVPVLAVDSNGLLPMAEGDRVFKTAYSFRRHLQKTLGEHLLQLPEPDPVGSAELIPLDPSILPELSRWPMAGEDLLSGRAAALDSLPLDQDVRPAGEGGRSAGLGVLKTFLEDRLPRYAEDRNSPDRDASSRLSPYLHWGQVSSFEVFHAVADREGWSPLRLSERTDGRRHGWWGMSEAAEAFLDELVTWREIGFNMCFQRPDDYDRYESLPDWARQTLAEHQEDSRPHVYDLDAFRDARTHDPLWNAAQRELVHEGRIHNYLRMLWGKKILEWSPSPRDALAVMVELNNRYALDGRDPNSYSGIFWVLGRYDRGWPERPIYGKVRSMSSDSTRRKVELSDYLRRFGES
jgi:deoxyribodipyrimidine photo-lyase